MKVGRKNDLTQRQNTGKIRIHQSAGAKTFGNCTEGL